MISVLKQPQEVTNMIAMGSLLLNSRRLFVNTWQKMLLDYWCQTGIYSMINFNTQFFPHSLNLLATELTLTLFNLFHGRMSDQELLMPQEIRKNPPIEMDSSDCSSISFFFLVKMTKLYKRQCGLKCLSILLIYFMLIISFTIESGFIMFHLNFLI